MMVHIVSNDKEIDLWPRLVVTVVIVCLKR